MSLEKDGSATGDAKPADGERKVEHLNLKVRSHDGTEVFFKVKRTTQLRKLMEAYCTRVGAQAGTLRFIYEGERINPNQTPEELGMEDDSQIDAMVEQTGGH